MSVENPLSRFRSKLRGKPLKRTKNQNDARTQCFATSGRGRIVTIIMLAAVTFTSIFGVLTYDTGLSFAQSDLTPDQQAALQSQLQQLETEIAQQQTILDQKQQEGSTLQNKIDVLNAKIKKAQLEIQAHQLAISKLGKDINVKVTTITALNQRIDANHQSLAQIIERTREIDDDTLVEAMLSTKNISDFFIDLDSFAAIKQSLQAHLTDIKSARAENQSAETDLSNQKNQEIDTEINVKNTQAEIQQDEDQEKQLLSANKSEQSNYQILISNKQKQAEVIRDTLFKLRDTASIKFGDAVTYAKTAAAKTGTPAAFMLAIIQQESNLGSNVGSCYLSNDATGAGVKANSGVAVANLMKPSRDVQPFLAITAALGRDPHKTLVSCPFSVGYGGAMGPAQFIPSTWVLLEGRIESALGESTTDPWSAQDAFMASALYLSDLGASGGTYTAERNAACRYYSGKSCSGSNTFYGDQVMARVSDIQSNIDALQSL